MILCIDPGFAHTGWCVINKQLKTTEIIATGCIHTTKDKTARLQSLDNVRRIKIVFNCLLEIIKVHQPKSLAIELPTGGAKSASAIKALAFVTGLVGCLEVTSGLPTKYVSPMDIKKVILNDATRLINSKKVGKDEIMQFVKDCYPNYNFPKYKKDREHICDAVIVGILASK